MAAKRRPLAVRSPAVTPACRRRGTSQGAPIIRRHARLPQLSRPRARRRAARSRSATSTASIAATRRCSRCWSPRLRIAACRRRVLTFEPNPRDYFAAPRRHARAAPARIATLRDKLVELERCGIEQVGGAALRRALRGAVARRPSSTTCSSTAWARATCWSATTSASARAAPATTRCSTPPAQAHGFDVARMMSYEVHGLRVSSSAVRAALAAGDMAARRGAARPALQHQRPRHPRRPPRPRARRERARARRRLSHPQPALPARAAGGDAASSSFACTGSATQPLDGVASLGRRPTVDDSGRVLLEVALLRLAARASAPKGATVDSSRVELLHKLRDEARYDSLGALADAIRQRRGRRARLSRRRPRRARRHRPADDARPNLIARPARSAATACAAARTAIRRRSSSRRADRTPRRPTPSKDSPPWLTRLLPRPPRSTTARR